MENNSREDYVERYYEENYSKGEVDKEIRKVGEFLIKNIKGRVLDCGCGPVPQLWAIFMPNAKEIHAIDLAKESISFVKKKLKNKRAWENKFVSYKNIVEKIIKKNLPKKYIHEQLNKIKSIKQADMGKKIPFPNNYFNNVMTIYSLGVLKNESKLKSAINERYRVLKNGGKLLNINTNGQNTNKIIPEYTWRGLPPLLDIVSPYLEKAGFTQISTNQIKLDKTPSMYYYTKINLLTAIKTS